MARRVFITGANRGLGYELAKQFIGSGDIVWGSGRPGRTDQLRALNPAGMVEMDVADEASIVTAIGRLANEVGKLDLLINCAGVDARALGAPEDPRGPFDLDAETFTAVIRINTTGPMVVTREALRLLRLGQDALVLNVSSQLGSMEVGAYQGRDTAYCVSKAALNMLSVKTAAAVKPEGIAVVALHPGWVSTDMGGSSARLTPVESASAIHATIGRLTMADTGRFILWTGEDHPW